MAVAAILCVAEGRISSDLLSLLPALLIAAVLFARRFPGERLLIAWSSRSSRRRRRAALTPQPSRHSPSAAPRGGLLMGFALAVRPPPLAPAS